jgi:hypothetical protein
MVIYASLELITVVRIPIHLLWLRNALNMKEASSLVESGFEHVTGEYSDWRQIFRKKKC